jgi:hypothetical protein
MAKAMKLATESWFEQGATRVPEGRSDDSRGIAGRVELLFDALWNPKTGKPYTNAEVARMTLGDSSNEDIEGIRDGAIGDPIVGQISGRGQRAPRSPRGRARQSLHLRAPQSAASSMPLPSGSGS